MTTPDTIEYCVSAICMTVIFIVAVKALNQVVRN